MAKLINGKEVSSKVKEEVRIETEKLLEKGIKPGLAVVIVGNDPASRVYVNSKKERVKRLDSIPLNMLFRRKPLRKNFCSLWKN
mgnify:CR=1 FL=1